MELLAGRSGEVVVRAIGSDPHMDYKAVGQTTHLAARMEQIADPGAIVITPETLALAEGYVAVKSLGPVPVKGLADPVEIYEVTGAGAGRTRSPRVSAPSTMPSAALARDLGDPELQIGVTFLLGQNHYGLGNYGRAIDILVPNVTALEAHPSLGYRVGSAPLSVTARCFLARAPVEVGDFQQAAAQAEEAIARSQGADPAFGLAHGFFALGLTRLRQGDLAPAIAALEQGVGIAGTRGVSFLMPLLTSHLGHVRALSGHLQEGLALLDQAQHDAKSAGRTTPRDGRRREWPSGPRRCSPRCTSPPGAWPAPPPPRTLSTPAAASDSAAGRRAS
jgi:tetratricopeptide (TPR) repeat protein